MITEYIEAALARATYEIIQDEEPYYGEIPGLQGVWASGKTLEECRRNLAETVEDWVLFSIAKSADTGFGGGIYSPSKEGNSLDGSSHTYFTS